VSELQELRAEAAYQRLVDAVTDALARAYPDWQHDDEDEVGWAAEHAVRVVLERLGIDSLESETDGG
jgi:hypothetical protein